MFFAVSSAATEASVPAEAGAASWAVSAAAGLSLALLSAAAFISKTARTFIEMVVMQNANFLGTGFPACRPSHGCVQTAGRRRREPRRWVPSNACPRDIALCISSQKTKTFPSRRPSRPAESGFAHAQRLSQCPPKTASKRGHCFAAALQGVKSVFRGLGT